MSGLDPRSGGKCARNHSAAEVPALIMLPSYNGSLAAIRCLGEQGVPIVVAMDRLIATGTWSRHVRERWSGPALAHGHEAVVRWLEERGRARPGMVLYPTSDEYAWLLAHAHERLSPHFHMYSPSYSVISRLLDKSQLIALCAASGVATPHTLLPTSAAEAARLVAERGPLLLKPRTQAFYTGPGKGALVSTPDAAAEAFEQYEDSHFPSLVTDACPDVAYPMLQEYVPTTRDGTYSISGFIDRAGQLLTHVACVKTRQSPPKVGVGLEFEVAPVRPEALDAVLRLCRHAGYFGVFEAEFVLRADAPLLIDFNPRYFGQMGFDVQRGSLLPWLAHLCAQGFDEDARRLSAEAPPRDTPSSYVHRVALGFELATRIAQPEMRHALRSALARARDRASADTIWLADDPLPALAAVLNWGQWAARHPRTLLKLLTSRQA